MSHRPSSGSSGVAPLRGRRAGTCSWCGEPVTGPGGSPSRRRWHDGREDEPDCLRDYKFSAGWANVVRDLVHARDGGVCAACPPGSPARSWDADHIVPLVDGGEHSLANLQTLCPTHHREKTAREATERAARRARERLEATGQGALL